MDFKINRESLSLNDIVYDGIQEQSVELDYVMPDYYPDIFKLVKCMLCPSVVSHSVSGDKLTYELLVKIKIMYCAEESNSINCVDQRMTFTKTVDFGAPCENADITFNTAVDYVNCRAVNQRRLDVRGAVSIKIRANCEKKEEVICDAFGGNIQLRKENVSAVGTRLCRERTFDVDEDVDISYSKPAINSIIRADAVNTAIDRKIIANKLITKGEAKVNFLYLGGEDNTPESMEFTLPYSQVIDIDGLDESYDCDVSAKIVCCEVTPHENDDGEMRTVSCKLVVSVKCRAFCVKNIQLVTDAYSTTNDCICNIKETTLETAVTRLCDTNLVTLEALCENDEIDKVFDVWANVKKCSIVKDEESKNVKAVGTLIAYVAVCTDDGKPAIIEAEKNFEMVFDAGDSVSVRDCCAEIVSVSYSISNTNSVEIKAEVKACVYASKVCRKHTVTDINLDTETVKKSEGYALKMYFAEEGEELWDIAKRYSTSVEAIIEENELDTENDGARMLLIPIVS